MFAFYRNSCILAIIIGCCIGITSACHDSNSSTTTGPTTNPTPMPSPFAGSFRREYTVEATQGGMISVTDTITLIQNGTALTGDRWVSGAHACCIASYKVAISGVASAERMAELSWGYAEGRCDGNSCWHGINTNGGTWSVNLSEDGSNLNFAPGWDYTRMTASSNSTE